MPGMKLTIIHCAVFTFILLVSSCNKRNKPADMKINDPDPDLTIQSVRGFISLDRTCPDYPEPSDSTSRLELDFDGDGNGDFEVISEHLLSTNHSCGSFCSCFEYSLKIAALHGKAAMSAAELVNSGAVAVRYESGVEISKKSSWKMSAFIIPEYFKDNYIGVRIGEKYGWMRLSCNKSVNSVTIHKYSLSGVKNKVIKAGEGD
jgi:hypothetical protein